MVNKKTQKVLIPKGTINPNEDTLIEIPSDMKDTPIVVAKKQHAQEEKRITPETTRTSENGKAEKHSIMATSRRINKVPRSDNSFGPPFCSSLENIEDDTCPMNQQKCSDKVVREAENIRQPEVRSKFLAMQKSKQELEESMKCLESKKSCHMAIGAYNSLVKSKASSACSICKKSRHSHRSASSTTCTCNENKTTESAVSSSASSVCQTDPCPKKRSSEKYTEDTEFLDTKESQCDRKSVAKSSKGSCSRGSSTESLQENKLCEVSVSAVDPKYTKKYYPKKTSRYKDTEETESLNTTESQSDEKNLGKSSKESCSKGSSTESLQENKLHEVSISVVDSKDLKKYLRNENFESDGVDEPRKVGRSSSSCMNKTCPQTSKRIPLFRATDSSYNPCSESIFSINKTVKKGCQKCDLRGYALERERFARNQEKLRKVYKRTDNTLNDIYFQQLKRQFDEARRKLEEAVFLASLSFKDMEQKKTLLSTLTRPNTCGNTEISRSICDSVPERDISFVAPCISKHSSTSCSHSHRCILNVHDDDSETSHAKIGGENYSFTNSARQTAGSSKCPSAQSSRRTRKNDMLCDGLVETDTEPDYKNVKMAQKSSSKCLKCCSRSRSSSGSTRST